MPSAQAQVLSFEAAVRQAMQSSPDVAAREYQVRAAQSAAVPAGALPDPKLFAGIDNFPVSGPNAWGFGEEMTMLTLGVMQDIPNGGKRRARVERAQAEIGAARSEIAAQHLDVALAAALAWLDLFYVERQVGALADLEAENRLLQDTVAPLIASGAAQPAEAVAPELAQAALADRRSALDADAAKAKAELLRWTGLAVDTPLPESAPVFVIDPEALRAGLETHPALRAYEAAIARAAAETREAEAAKWPDLGIQGAVHHRDPQFGWMVSAQVTFDLPLFASTRQDPLIAAKALQTSRVRLERDAVHRRLTAELQGAMADYTFAREALQRSREITLPLTGRKVELQMASYRAGTAPLDMVLAARRERLETELAALDREAKMTKAAARLTILFGGVIP